MHITFHHTSHQNVDKVTTSYYDSRTQKQEKADGYAIDISDTVMDNVAYRVQGRTAEEVMQKAGNQDVAMQRNYMAVMSNSMSDEEFAEMVKEGASPMDMELEEAVTIIDKIKAELLKAGKQITGYTDSLDMETLSQITGSSTLAQALVHSFTQQGIPVTEENIKAGAQTADKAGEIEKITEGVIKYMIENHLEPTVENLYRAQYSSAAGQPVRNTPQIDTDALADQIEQIVKEAGFPESEKYIEDAKWLVDKGIPLTKETLAAYEVLNAVSLPLQEETVCHAIASALAEGKAAKDANVGDERSIYEKAVEAEADILREIDTNVTAKRQAEEIRLLMTTQANIKLLRSGYYINTKDLEDFVEKLKELEQKQAEALFGKEQPLPKFHLYQQTMEERSSILSMPAEVLGKISYRYSSLTVHEVYTHAEETAAVYKQANESYETFMTAPRADLGDRIQKAFQNTDEILQDLKLPVTDENRRAVRILGYNSMELNMENIQSVKDADRSLQKTVNKMTPAAVLKMIREGVNPLETSLKDLNNYFDSLEPSYQEESEKYSRYLYRLERNQEITEPEKEAYIGIYRLLRQIEKTDGAAIGQLLKQGADLEFKNLLSAVRTGKLKGIDVRMDQTYGGLEELVVKGVSISEQIAEGFRNDFTGMLSDLSGTQEEADYLAEGAKQFREIAAVEDEVLQMCNRFSLPVTGNNLMAVSGMLGEKISPFHVMNRFGRRFSDSVKQEVFKLQENFDSPKEAQKAYEEFAESTQKLTQEYTFTESVSTQDIKTLQLLHKQLSVVAGMAKQEEYEVPVVIGEEITSIHLVLKHHSRQAGTVNVRMHTTQAGEFSAQFGLSGNKVNGQIHYSSESEAVAKQIETHFLAAITKDGFEADSIRSTSIKLNPGQGEEASEQQPVETARLYQLAKIFIRAVQEQ